VKNIPVFTQNTNEENFVKMLIAQEKPRPSGEFTRKRLAVANCAKGWFL
jgi:hypothetical protein